MAANIVWPRNKRPELCATKSETRAKGDGTASFGCLMPLGGA